MCGEIYRQDKPRLPGFVFIFPIDHESVNCIRFTPMSEIFLPKQNELSVFPKWQDMLLPVLAQIEKDFRTSGLEWKTEINSAKNYPELFELLLPHIHFLLDRHSEQLMQLLYRVDIPEDQLKKSAGDFPEKSFPQLVTELIILRELHKTLIFKHYSR